MCIADSTRQNEECLPTPRRGKSLNHEGHGVSRRKILEPHTWCESKGVCVRLTAFFRAARQAAPTAPMNAPKIAVVGSYATGLTMKVGRLPSQGETLLGTGYRVDHGGKGSNQAVGCARLGARVSFVAKIGKDAFGDSALKLYREEGVNTEHVIQTGATATGVGFIIVEAASGHNCITIDPGANELLSAAEVAKVDFSGCKV